jgi:hypothetical protein
MRNGRKIRGGAVLVVATFALVGATQAFGAFSPKATVATSEATNTTTIVYTQGAADDTVGKLTFYVPATAFAPASQTSGDPVGKATAKTASGTLSGDIIAGAGADPVTIGGAPMTLAAAWTACVGSPPPGPANTSNYWVMNLAGGGQSVALPIFFVSINQDQPFGDGFIGALTICLPATLKPSELTIALVDAVSTVPGWSNWALRATPYAGATLNNAGAVELSAQDRLPWDVTLSAKARKVRGSVVVSGKVAQGSVGVAGATVRILAGKKVVATLKTKGGGKYSGTVTTSAKSLVASATGAARTLGGCTTPRLAPLPCVSATISGFAIATDPISVRS